MWERFSYYGLRAILLLYMMADPAQGGLGFPIGKASAIYSLYASMNYLLALPGGWLADKVLGLRNSVLIGGTLIAIGNGLMYIPGLTTFYFGLVGIVVGTGLLKTNASTMVGTLYSENDPRRDAGFSIYYMGINIGALVSPLVVGYLAQKVNWRYGFPVASSFMLIGLVQFYFGAKYFPQRVFQAVPPANVIEQQERKRYLMIGAAVVAALIAAAYLFIPTVEALADSFGAILLAIVVAVLGWLLLQGSPNLYEKRRLAVVCILFFVSTLFWSSFEQAGSTLNLFAEKNTVELFPSTWYQSFNSLFLIPLAPVFATLWVRMGDKQPSVPAKFMLGLVCVGLGYVWLMAGAQGTMGGGKVSPIWLVGTYFLHTVGELLLSPVGLSAMTRLAPERMAGFIMGVFFLSISCGNYIGGRLAVFYEKLPLPQLFGGIGAFCIVVALLFGLFVKPVARMMEGQKS